MKNIADLAQGIGYTSASIAPGTYVWIEYLDNHYQAFMALGVLVSTLIAILSFGLSWYFRAKAFKQGI